LKIPDKENKIILITGCNGNLAKDVIKYFTSLQYDVIGCDIYNDTHKKTQNAKNAGLKFYKKCNLENQQEIKNLVDELKEKKIFPKILLNNAVIDFVPDSDLQSNGLEMSGFYKIFSVNLLAPVLLSTACIYFFKKNKIKGIILNISSIYSLVSPDPNLYQNGFVKNILYGASKASLNNITKQIAVICAKEGIRVNSVLLAGIEAKQNKEFKSKYEARIPIGRMMKVNEILPLLEFMISEKNTYMTGELVKLDGGYCSI
jgi:NAD(P)-dependent dehydrogenase (short-subunit alcohol dehydrogenase family)